MNNLTTSQREEWTPSLQAQKDRGQHREWIAGRILTLLSHYWRDDDDDALTSAIAADWVDVLEGIPNEYLQKACIQYQRDEDRRKPTPGAIYRLAMEMMPRPKLAYTAPPPPEREPRCDPEVAAAICKAAGYTPKTFGGKDDT